MSRQANGTYQQPANTAAVSGQSISSSAFNTLITDIGTEITNSLDRLGRSAMSAALPMGGNKVTGAADPTASTDLATKNYVDTTTASFFSTGDVKLTLKTSADTGWIIVTSGAFGNGTIGSASSGANLRANADTQALFTLLFNNLSDANAPLLTSGGAATTRAAQTNASTAWAANCRIQVGFFAGRALGVAGNPADLQTNRNLGDHLGAETVTLGTTNLPAYTPAGNVASSITYGGGLQNGYAFIAPGTNVGYGGTATGGTALALSGNLLVSSTFTGTAQGGNSTPVSLMQPSVFLNCMVKL